VTGPAAARSDAATGPSPGRSHPAAELDRRAVHEAWMRRALAVAGTPASSAATSADDPGADVPVGAVLYDRDGTELAAARNERELTADPTAHAEVLVLRRGAAALGTSRLDGCTLVVTLEPCTMCAGALVLARVATVVFGAWEPKTGAVGSLWDVVRDRRLNHRPDVYAGVLEVDCARLLRGFFRPPAGP
jgi:tRNA(adenine34) deaminase